MQACIVSVSECAHVCGSRGQAVHSEDTQGCPGAGRKASLPQGHRTWGGRVPAKKQGLGNPYRGYYRGQEDPPGSDPGSFCLPSSLGAPKSPEKYRQREV